MFERFFAIITGLFLFYSSISWAAVVPQGFNIGNVLVASPSAADLHLALVSAFEQVLIKFSGNSRITTVPDIQKQLALVDRYVQKYNYVDNNLIVTFDQRALINLLVQAQQPVWVSERPASLIRLSINNQAPLTWNAAAPDSALVFLQSIANQRALPLVFPDAQAEAGAVDPSALEKLTEIYHTPAVLSGNLKPDPANASNWLADWLLVWHGQNWQWSGAGAQEQVLREAVNKLADILGSQLSIHLDQKTGNTFWVAVLGITQLADYQNLLQSIQQLHPVLGVYVQDIGSHGLLMQVTAASEGSDAFRKALSDNPRFTLVSDAPASNTAAELLTYEWRAS